MHVGQYQSAGPSSTPYSTSAASAEPVTHRVAVTAAPTGIARATESVPGRGRVVLDASGTDAVFSSLAYSYPLKLLSPRCTHPRIGVAYLLSYGGGLVGGDEIILDVRVQRGARLVLLTQGTTKIFKQRTGGGTAGFVNKERQRSTGGVTKQTMNVTIEPDSALFLLPDAATCFEDAAYEQRQTFNLVKGASAVILDSLTAGRISRGEEWAFARYCSINELWIDGRRIARDAVLLDAEQQQHDLRARLAPYGCYSTLFLVGPLVQACIDALAAEYSVISQMRVTKSADLLWSMSLVDAASGAVVVRIAGTETEAVRSWLKGRLERLREVLGDDTMHMAFLP